MRKFLGLLALVFVSVCAWRVGNSLSSDAVSMAVGILFGVLAGLPAALLVLAGERRRAERYADHEGGARRTNRAHPYEQQPPVVVVTGPGYQQQQPALGDSHAQPGFINRNQPFQAGYGASGWSAPRPHREFTVVGEEAFD